MFRLSGSIGDREGYFRFGSRIVCYGRMAGDVRAGNDGPLTDALEYLRSDDDSVTLPFDPDVIVSNLQYERYTEVAEQQRWIERRWSQSLYYWLRPAIPTVLRRCLQRAYLSNWNALSFPNWPVDRTADVLRERLLALTMSHLGIERLPFIWFWPDSHSSCAIVAHDVETQEGRDFSERLMDIDDEYGIPASFQIVPERRYDVPPSYLDAIRSRGFDVNVHGLDHEGNLFDRRGNFLDRARKINAYAHAFASEGFRSPSMYRNADLFQDLDFSYDMSVPSVARLEAQRGGCCTVMPYFLPGGMLELPLTTTEDYTLFHILKDYSTALWTWQAALILDGHGLMSFLIHPDYIRTAREMDVYRDLLVHLNRLKSDHGVWLAKPGDVNRWWRDRAGMELVADGGEWRIHGPGSERARVAYACLDGNELVYETP